LSDSHPAWHYDGKTAVRREAALTPREAGFDLTADGLRTESYAWGDLVYRGEKTDGPYYGHINHPGWQIGLTDPLPDALFNKLPKPKRYGGFIDRVGLVPASIISVVVSAGLIFGVTKVPEVVAPLVPMSWERSLGDAMLGDMGGRFCETPASRKAIDAMTARLNSKGDPIEINIANIDMVNAVALPGGKVVIFRGLLQEAKNADELAGVLGHEIGHVRNRDVMQSLLRQMGLSVLLGGANTNAAGALNTLVSSSYSREAESAADNYSIKLMQKAAISPEATAGFFDRLSADEEKVGKAAAALGYLSSHPLSETREKAFRTSKQAGVAHTPVVSPEQWRAIVDACAQDPDVEKSSGFPF
jgi:beta-barrel assembly-enhancing protease